MRSPKQTEFGTEMRDRDPSASLLRELRKSRLVRHQLDASHSGLLPFGFARASRHKHRYRLFRRDGRHFREIRGTLLEKGGKRFLRFCRAQPLKELLGLDFQCSLSELAN